MDKVPWVLTHNDLEHMNILADRESRHITGIVDWADASIEPFGMCLYGLERLLGYSGPSGWTFFENDRSRSRTPFRNTFLAEVGGKIPDKTLNAIEEVRTLGLLLREGFSWQGDDRKPDKDTAHLEMFLKGESPNTPD